MTIWDAISVLLTPTTKGEVIFWGFAVLAVLAVAVVVGSFALGWSLAK